MKYNDIQAIQAKHIKNLVNAGWTLRPCELSGSYSRVDWYIIFGRNNERRIIWAEEVLDAYIAKRSGKNNGFPGYVIHYSAITLADGETLRNSCCWPNDWAENDAYEINVYSTDVAARDDSWYTLDLDEVKKAYKTRTERRHLRRDIEVSVEVPVSDAVLSFARKQDGFKTVRKNDLTVVKRVKEFDWDTNEYVEVAPTYTFEKRGSGRKFHVLFNSGMAPRVECPF